MKINNKLYLVGFMLCMLLGLTQTTTAQQASITSIIANNTSLDFFQEAIELANLTSLDTAGPYTVVVPSDNSFRALPAQVREDLFSNPNELRKLVLYHVVKGTYALNQLPNNASYNTLYGEPIRIDSRNGSLYVNQNAQVVNGDFGASNGIVHIIDKVLLPPDSAFAGAMGGGGNNTTSTTNTESESATAPVPANSDAPRGNNGNGQILGLPPLPVAGYKITIPTQNSAYVSGGTRPYWSGVYGGGNGCRGMTWVTHQIENGYSKVGADRLTNPWRGDTACTEALPILCYSGGDLDAPPGTVTANYADHWSKGQIRLTGYVNGTELTSENRANRICSTVFGTGWRMAEFHDSVTGNSIGDGWYFWGQGGVPAGIRFWVSIFDQPANPWDSVISRAAPGPVAYGGSYFDDPVESNTRFTGWYRMTRAEGLNYGRAACKGTTWTLLKQYTNGLALVGADSSTNPYLGDRSCSRSYPVLCINVVGYGTPPASFGNDYTYKWSAGAIQHTQASYSGVDIGSRRDANRICRATFGNGYRMAAHHDGSLGTNGLAGWEFWGFGGGLRTNTRFWVAVNDQRANPWNN